jgi:hypothetical protein
MNTHDRQKEIEIPSNFLRVTLEKFHQVSDQVFYVRKIHKNATSYRFRSSRLHSGEGEVFGYLDDMQGQFYLRRDILDEVNADTWDSKAV